MIRSTFIRSTRISLAWTLALTASIWFGSSCSFAADPVATTKTTASETPSSTSQSSRRATVATSQKPRNPRVLFITSKDSKHSADELARLQLPHGEFARMRAMGWTIGAGPENMVQIVDRDEVPQFVDKLNVQEYPTVACIDHEEVVRYFRSGCTTPLDAWTFGFLAKGIDERPAGSVKEEARVEWTGHYPLRGNHWSVEGDWNPSKEKTVEHLHGPNHESHLEASWKIEEWSLEELRSLHDDLHEKYPVPGSGFSNDQNSGGGKPAYMKFKG